MSECVSESDRATASRCEIWGVLNVTSDSFSDGGRYLDLGAALAHARVLVEAGADVIDVGGASSRPRGATYGQGAPFVPEAEELSRVVPVVHAIARELRVRVSIDTTSAAVAEAALEAGASIVNDVSFGAHAALLQVTAARRADYVLMHSRAQGEVTPENTVYADVVHDVVSALLAGVQRAARFGVAPERVWLDPGLGFAKTAAQSVTLLAHTDALVRTGHRVLVGSSRKGFIAEFGARPNGSRPAPAERDAGTIATVIVAAQKGACAVRVHDVASTWQALRIMDAVRGQSSC